MAGEGTKRIIDLTEAAETQSGDYIAIDSTGRGTRKLPAGFMATAEDLSEEQTARQTADATLDGKITAEAQARLDADNAIGDQITALDEKTEADAALIQNPTKTLSGALVSFTDGADMPMVACTAEIVPKQSGTGTPSPYNVRTISGWESVVLTDAGKNIVDWVITENTFATSYNGFGQGKWQDRMEIPASWAGKTLTYSAYFVTGSEANQAVKIWLYKDGTYLPPFKTGNYITANSSGVSSITITIPSSEEANQIAFGLSAGGGTIVSNPQVELGSTVTTFEPYNGTTTPVNLGRTVYGGTPDVVTGVLTVDRAMVTLDGSSDEQYVAGAYGMAFRTYLPNDFKPTTNNRELAGLVSNQMAEVTQASTWGTVGTCAVIANTNQLYFKLADDLTDVSALRTYLASNPLQIVYPLAEPQTIQLTPTQINTLLGENNVWADSGDVEITYRRDISIVINNLESALNG